MTNDLFFYIICPAYNSSKYIIDAINSLRNQTYPYWELIIIDDGSGDDTFDVISKQALDDKRIIPLRKTNEGPYLAREYGINYLRTISLKDNSYVLFLDADDMFRNCALSTLLEYIRQYDNLDFILFNSDWTDSKGNIRNKYYNITDIKLCSSTKDILVEATIDDMYSYIWSIAVKSDLLLRLRNVPDNISNLIIAEDYVKMVLIYMSSTNSLFVPDSLYLHRDVGSGITHDMGYLEWLDWLKGMDYIYENIRKSYPILIDPITAKTNQDFLPKIIYVIENYIKNNGTKKSLISICNIINSFYFLNTLNDNYIKNKYYSKVFLMLQNNNYKKLFCCVKKHMLKKRFFIMRNLLLNKYRHIKRSIFLLLHFPKKKISTASIFANNCIGGSIYKNAKQKYLSPLIWSILSPLDMAKLANHLYEYLQLTPSDDLITDIKEKRKQDPYALLGDIKITFPHCKDYDDIKTKWTRRLSRVNYNKIYIIVFVEKGDKITNELVDEYNKIKYKKVMIGFDENHLGIKNYYKLKCPPSLTWYNSIHQIKQYWELYNWKKFFK